MSAQVAKTAMSSTLIYCVTVLTVFLIVYSVVLSLNPEYTTNVVYLKTLGFVSLILVANDVVGYVSRKDKMAVLGFGAFMLSLALVSMLPKNLLTDFSMIEAAGVAITPLILVGSLFSFVKKEIGKQFQRSN